MRDMLKLDRLNKRLKSYVLYSEEAIPVEFEKLLSVLLINGEIPKSELPKILECSERKARYVAVHLIQLELIRGMAKKGPYVLNLNTSMLNFLFPGLIPPKDAF